MVGLEQQLVEQNLSAASCLIILKDFDRPSTRKSRGLGLGFLRCGYFNTPVDKGAKPAPATKLNETPA